MLLLSAVFFHFPVIFQLILQKTHIVAAILIAHGFQLAVWKGNGKTACPLDVGSKGKGPKQAINAMGPWSIIELPKNTTQNTPGNWHAPFKTAQNDGWKTGISFFRLFRYLFLRCHVIWPNALFPKSHRGSMELLWWFQVTDAEPKLQPWFPLSLMKFANRSIEWLIKLQITNTQKQKKKAVSHDKCTALQTANQKKH